MIRIRKVLLKLVQTAEKLMTGVVIVQGRHANRRILDGGLVKDFHCGRQVQARASEAEGDAPFGREYTHEIEKSRMLSGFPAPRRTAAATGGKRLVSR